MGCGAGVARERGLFAPRFRATLTSPEKKLRIWARLSRREGENPTLMRAHRLCLAPGRGLRGP